MREATQDRTALRFNPDDKQKSQAKTNAADAGENCPLTPLLRPRAIPTSGLPKIPYFIRLRQTIFPGSAQAPAVLRLQDSIEYVL